MYRVALLGLMLAAGSADAQENPFLKAPAEVDNALRARIWEFFDLHVKGQFRKAEELVAEDTKDFFYTHNKPQYVGFEITKIEYSDHFTKAKATVLCEQYVVIPGFTDKPMKVPTPSTWKLENGNWYWYVDPEALRMTPWGKMTAGPALPGAKPSPAVSTAMLDNVTVDMVLKQVKVDKDTLDLVAGTIGQVKIVNTAPGNLEIMVRSAPEGIEAKLEKGNLATNEKTVLNLRAGRNASGGEVTLQVEPTGQLIPIKIAIK
jgi:hypothetical protein